MNIAADNIKYAYVNKNLDENFKCLICGNPLFNPVSTNCNPEPHTFCSNCIKQEIKINPLCPAPTCKQEVHDQDLKPNSDVNFMRFLNNQQVKCLACEQTDLKRIDFDAHYKICPKVEVQCPSADVGCSWKGTRDQLDAHMMTCGIIPLKNVLLAYQIDSQKLKDIINKLQTDRDKLNSDNKQLKDRMYRQRSPHSGPMKAAQLVNDKLDYKQAQVTEPVKFDTQFNNEIISQQLIRIVDSFNQQRIQIEVIARDKEQLNDELNKSNSQNAVLQGTIKEMKTRLDQYLGIESGTIQESLSDQHANQNHGNNPGGRTENDAYSPAHRGIPNIPVDTSGYDQPLPPNYSNANPCSATAQNTFNRPGMEPFIIPISISISVHTNIVQENTGTNGVHTTNNIAGGNNISICAGNISIGGDRHNNVAGGINNRIAGGNNYGGEGGNNNLVNGNNNDGGINNAGGYIDNRDVRANNGGTNNAGGIISGGVGSNNRAGNNITGNGNNIAGGCDNSIVSGIISIGGNSNNIAGGYKNYIASGNNIVYNNNNNHNNHNDTPNDNGSEDGTNSSVDHPNDEPRSEISSTDDRIRANLDEPHPPYRNNHRD